VLVLANANGKKRGGGNCTSNLDCQLNGYCSHPNGYKKAPGVCVCNSPWSGAFCGTLGFKITPATAKSLYNITDPRNTWNGPIVRDANGKFHIYDPIYHVGSLGGPTSIKHGTADNVTGPWEWTSQPDIKTYGENPAFVVFKNASGKTIYSLWEGGIVRVADSPYGPFTKVDGYVYPGGNPAPIYHNGSFYLTNQHTSNVFTTPYLGGNWTTYATIDHSMFPHDEYHVEDPFMWIDLKGNWHIINHAYSNLQYDHCGNSTVSAHFYSEDGKTWHWSPDPYGHTVHYDDGTSHTYTTLERPNMVFSSDGQVTHLNLAADLVTGDEGCGDRPDHRHFGHVPCDNCKWDDHAGTIIVALDVY